MIAKYDIKLTYAELENIRLALTKRAYSMETYLVRSKEVPNEQTLRRDIHTSRELIKMVEDIMKNGQKTWSA